MHKRPWEWISQCQLIKVQPTECLELWIPLLIPTSIMLKLLCNTWLGIILFNFLKLLFIHTLWCFARFAIFICLYLYWGFISFVLKCFIFIYYIHPLIIPPHMHKHNTLRINDNFIILYKYTVSNSNVFGSALFFPYLLITIPNICILQNTP